MAPTGVSLCPLDSVLLLPLHSAPGYMVPTVLGSVPRRRQILLRYVQKTSQCLSATDDAAANTYYQNALASWPDRPELGSRHAVS